jgi:hypothetical protein
MVHEPLAVHGLIMAVSKFLLIFYFVYCAISERTTILKLMSSLNVHLYLAFKQFLFYIVMVGDLGFLWWWL